jgi:hypothetical protein
MTEKGHLAKLASEAHDESGAHLRDSGNFLLSSGTDVLVEAEKIWRARRALGVFTALVCVLGLAGCFYVAQFTEQIYEGPKRDPKDVAVLQESYVLSVTITHVDKVDVTSGRTASTVGTYAYELVPGPHEIRYIAHGWGSAPDVTDIVELELQAGRTYTVKRLVDNPYWKQYWQTAAYIVDETSGEVLACEDQRRYSHLGCGSSESIFFNIPRSACEGPRACEIVIPDAEAHSKARRSEKKAACQLALAIGDEEPHWDERLALRAHVDEAKRLGLTPEICAALLKRGTTE